MMHWLHVTCAITLAASCMLQFCIGNCESAVSVRMIEYESNRALRFEFESNVESNRPLVPFNGELTRFTTVRQSRFVFTLFMLCTTVTNSSF